MQTEHAQDDLSDIGMLRLHDRDLYRGNGKPGIMSRLNDLENYKARINEDLYDSRTGIVPLMRNFFAVLDEREKHTNSKMARYMVALAAAAMLSPILWDWAKHGLGWAVR